MVFMPKKSAWQSRIILIIIILFSVIPSTILDYSIDQLPRFKNLTYFTVVLSSIFLVLRYGQRYLLNVTNFIVFSFANFIVLTLEISSVYGKSDIQNQIITQKPKPIVDVLKRSITQNKNVYILLTDGYPSEKSIHENFNLTDSLYTKILKQYSFRGFPNNNNYLQTPLSISSKFFDIDYKDSNYEFNYFDLSYLHDAVIPNSEIFKFCKAHNYTFEFESLLNQKHHFNTPTFGSLWLGIGLTSPIFTKLSIAINYYFERYIVKNHLPNQEMTVMQKLIISHPKQDRQINFFHLLTFHHSKPFDFYGTEKLFFTEQLAIAQKTIAQSINHLIKIDPSSTIVIVSDHGERNAFHNPSSKDGILYIRN